MTELSVDYAVPGQLAGPARGAAFSGTDLVGRGRELGLVSAFLDRVQAGGEVLLVVGEAGVGKSALLDSAERMASGAGLRVLRAGGTEFEMGLRFAALNQVLLPLREEFERMSPACRGVLDVALGFSAGAPPDGLAVTNAVVELLGQAAARRPVLMIVDDLPWVDRPSAAVLGFVVRRLAGSRVGFLGALRSGQESFFEQAGLPELEVGPLDECSSSSLLCSRFPALAPAARERLLAEAGGNPLALLELPAALSPSQLADGADLPDMLPLSRRLQGLFAARVRELPSRTRRVLLRAALDGTGEPMVVAGGHELEDLAAAERTHLVSVVGNPRRIEFRHPLTRSAVVELATESERRAAHRELADIWRDQPDRRAWHLAESAIGPDAEVAALLEQSARRVLRRGDAATAIAGLTRAAEMSTDAASRGRRLAEAAYIGAEGAGELGSASELLTMAQLSDPGLGGSLHASAATAMLLLNRDGDLTTAHRLLATAVSNAERGDDAYDSGLIEALYTLAVISFLGGQPKLWEPVYREIGRLGHLPTALSVVAKTFSDPARTGKTALDDFEALAAVMDSEADPATINRIATGALFIDRVGSTRPASWRVITQGRHGGPARRHLSSLIHLCLDDFHTGQWEEAGQLASEGLAVCEEHGYRLLTWYFQYTQALTAAASGDHATTRALADEVIGWAVPRGVHGAAALVRHALVLSAIGRGDFEDAYRQATAISPAGELASHVPGALWVSFDLVEAAARTGRLDEGRAHVAAMSDADTAAISPRLALLQHGAAALIASGAEATRRFDQALAIPGAARWPFDRARVRLAYGEHLRRGRATVEARGQLAAALEIFERLGAAPWAARAAGELRATGTAKPRARELTPDPLTPQEREIAALAAAGLSNKQIAQRLFLSPKTVGNHLFRIFPKLGITSRAALRDVLATMPAAQPAR